MSRHIADAESTFVVVNVTPDFCEVNGQVVPYDIYQELTPEKDGYSEDVEARGGKVLVQGSVVRGVVGNMGKGVLSGVAQSAGHTLLVEGESTVTVDGKPIVRHGHRCVMNVEV